MQLSRAHLDELQREFGARDQQPPADFIPLPNGPEDYGLQSDDETIADEPFGSWAPARGGDGKGRGSDTEVTPEPLRVITPPHWKGKQHELHWSFLARSRSTISAIAANASASIAGWIFTPLQTCIWFFRIWMRRGLCTRAETAEWLGHRCSTGWKAEYKPVLVVIDSIAAVFDGEAIARRQVRAFFAMFRKIARDHGMAIVLLDHPSVRGMADGTGTANSVDRRNSVRSPDAPEHGKGCDMKRRRRLRKRNRQRLVAHARRLRR
jgi:hypothetical protein